MRPFQTARLCARPMDETDASLYRELYTNPQVMRHIAAPLSRKAAERAFAAAMHQATRPDPRLRVWVLAEIQTRLRIGILALTGQASGARCEWGAMLLPPAQGRGFAVEAQSALLDQIFTDSRVDMIWSRNKRGNLAADAVWRKLGFVEVGNEGCQDGSALSRMSRERWSALGAERGDVAELPSER